MLRVSARGVLEVAPPRVYAPVSVVPRPPGPWLAVLQPVAEPGRVAPADVEDGQLAAWVSGSHRTSSCSRSSSLYDCIMPILIKAPTGPMLPLYKSVSSAVYATAFRNATYWATVTSYSAHLVIVGDRAVAARVVALDNTTGYGSVAYDYKMGAYDVTVAQYVAFLNAVATTADTYGLYNSNMEAFSGALDNISITQSYSKKAYTYSFSDSPDPQAGNCPIFNVTWGDAARFCNWLANGQPTGAEGPGTTETGAYTLGGAPRAPAAGRDAQPRARPTSSPRKTSGTRPPTTTRPRARTGPTPRRATRPPATCCRRPERTTPIISMAATRDPDKPTDAGGGVCRLARPLRHLRHGRRRVPVERGRDWRLLSRPARR